MHGQLHVTQGCLWVDLMRSPDVSVHVSLTGVLAEVEHDQDVLTHVAFAPSPSFVLFVCVSLSLFVFLSGVCERVVAGLGVCRCAFVCFPSCVCASGLAPSLIHVPILSQKVLLCLF